LPSDTWRGIFPAICTAFTSDDAVDLDAQRRVVRFVLDSGAHGIVAFGLAGEVLKLSTDERKKLTDTILDEVGQGGARVRRRRGSQHRHRARSSRATRSAQAPAASCCRLR
jgi:hypothetical protein